MNNQFQSLAEYFIKTYTSKEKLHYLRTNEASLKNPDVCIISKDNFVQGISSLSSTDFDTFLKHFTQFLNLQIATDITRVLQFNGFYIKSCESLDENQTLKINKNLPKEIKSEVTTRVRPKVEQTNREIHRLQKTIVDDSLIRKRRIVRPV